ncbi:MAG: methylenetetrahydrofolate--tRNA-(uracil(54)-C(5))-methyltransferase (FADH(2)-oxidizing) TrmFO [Acholeplasmataceae bacterium]
MVKIIGAGLAGSEAAWYLANKGIKVNLYEMRPIKQTEVHKTSNFAELVCSNSFRSKDPHNAVGLLKEEMKLMNSLILESALKNEVPAGSSLAVDRNLFSDYITDKIKNHPLITIYNEEVKTLNKDELTIIAAGPLVSSLLAEFIKNELKQEELHFYDAVAPIISAESIDYNKVYFKSRYDKGSADYLNCPLNELEYKNFYHELINAERVIPKDFELNVFEGCMPIETMAERGIDTLRFGPLKPVGLEKDNQMPYAVIQLRQDDVNQTMYNIVGFQTQLKWGEQKRIINMIPGLEKAEILRYGVIHKNTYIESPKVLNNLFQVKNNPNWFFAGQISGVEGYVESAASGLMVAHNILSVINNNKPKEFPRNTMMGSLANYISSPNKNFVPMNANFGLFLPVKIKKSLRRKYFYDESIKSLNNFLKDL